tara:strand:+ start:87 stop:308 length:222 start_codon:yes stop_codon:yes gene_type:complete
MIKFIKDYPYYTIAILLIILKILGIINWSWWIVTLPIWWWWPIMIGVASAVVGYVLFDEIIKKIYETWRNNIH